MFVLMIKRAYPTGLLYLCQTSKQDPYRYKGSGKRWINHLRAHKPHIITCVLGTYETHEELKEAGIYYSKLYNVVESDDWANLREEDGMGGGRGKVGRRWKIKDTSRMRGPKKIDHLTYEKVSSGNNYQSTHFIKTPWGVFETWLDATNSAKVEREKGNFRVVTDTGALKEYCKGKILNIGGRRTVKEWRGKHTHDLGFGLELKNVR